MLYKVEAVYYQWFSFGDGYEYEAPESREDEDYIMQQSWAEQGGWWSGSF